MNRNIKLVFNEADFQDMKKHKAKSEKELKVRLSWENFVFKTIVGK